MKGHNHSKFNPKARKKKHATLLKQIQMKQHAGRQKQKTPSKQTAPLEKMKPVKRKKPYHVNQRQPTWRLPAMLLVTGLIMIILIIPTLIVVPFAKVAQNESSPIEKAPEPIVDVDDSKESKDTNKEPLSVAVMRSSSETVEDIPLETYVAGVVSSEMSPSFETEALKAQALAARTYIVDHMLHQKGSEKSDVTDTTQHQVYKNENELKKLWGSEFEENMKKITDAVTATQGEILTYKDAPIFPAFFSTSNGYTENSEDYWEDELPYLRSVKSPWDEDSPKYLDQQTFTIDQVGSELGINLPDKASLGIEVTRTDSQRVKELGIEGNTFSGREVREKLSLQSSDFTIKQKNNHLIFTTKGWGHGIGMSQYGANSMAKKGKGYQEIVKYYYKDVEVSTVTDTAPTLVAR